MRTFIEDIIYDRGKSVINAPLRLFLRILSIGYRLIVSARNFLYDRQILKSRDVPCRVVSIGNLTMGGTGKTPVVIMTARRLKDAGYRVAVVSRGYRRKGKTPRIVSDGETVLSSPQKAGDEPHIIASSLQGVPVIVGAGRYSTALLAWESFMPDVIVLDDAFQHRRLYRNVDVVTLDAENLYGNGNLLPRGILREPPLVLKRSKAVVVTRFHDGLSREGIECMVRYYDSRVPIFLCEHVPSGIRPAGNENRTSVSDDTISCPDDLKGLRIAALSNIACPDSFSRTLVLLGAEIVLRRIMPDHHRYVPAELESIVKESLEAGADMLVMTAKDERNLPEEFRFNKIQAYVLDIEARLIEGDDEYFDIIKPKNHKNIK